MEYQRLDEEKFLQILQQGDVRQAVAVYSRVKESNFRLVNRIIYLRVFERYIRERSARDPDEVYGAFCELYRAYRQEDEQGTFHHANLLGKALVEAGDGRVKACQQEGAPTVYHPEEDGNGFGTK